MTPKRPNFRRPNSQTPSSAQSGSNSNHSPSSRMSHASSASGFQTILSNDMKRAIEFRNYPSSGPNTIKSRSSGAAPSFNGNNQSPGTLKSFSPSVSNYSSEKPTSNPTIIQMYQEGSSKTLMKDLLIRMQQQNLAKIKAVSDQMRK